MSEMKHTPTKWSIHKRSDEPVGTLIIGHEGQNVADCSSWHMGRSMDEAGANAAYIVECVNSHASLVEENARLREALTGLVEKYEEIVTDDNAGRSLRDWDLVRAKVVLNDNP